MSQPVQYTVVTIDNDTLELSSTFSFKPGEDALVWIWISKTLKPLCGFVLRPSEDNEPLPKSDDNIHYSLVAATVIPNKPKPAVAILPTTEELLNSNDPCEKYQKLFVGSDH